MSSSTALLPKAGKKDSHPIFLRVCHSPWICISQKILVAARGFIATYMAIVLMMFIYYDIQKVEAKGLIPFDLANISYVVQAMYALTTLSWTYMHLHYPHHGSAIPSHSTRLQKFFSPPRQHQTTKNRAFFSIFHTAAVTLPHVVTLVYWLILVPHNEANPLGLTDTEWFKNFIIYNRYGVNSFIALIEVLILSSIRRQEPIWAHIFGLSMLSVMYVGWAYIGKFITGFYIYFFFDVNKVGWEHVLIAIVSLGGLSNVFFAVVFGLTGLREMLTAKSDDKNIGYTRLPE